MVDWCPTQTLTPEETVTRSFALEPSGTVHQTLDHGTLDMVSPPGGPSVQPRGTIVRVTGHFDDPAAAGCVIRTTAYQSTWVVWTGAAELLCREQFVVTEIEKTGFMALPQE